MMCDFRRVFNPTPEEKKHDYEFIEKIYNDQKKNRDCHTCVNCIITGTCQGYPEAKCVVGYEPDPVYNSRKNCDQYIEKEFCA